MSLRARIRFAAGFVLLVFVAIMSTIMWESWRAIDESRQLTALLAPEAQRAERIALAQIDAARAQSRFAQTSNAMFARQVIDDLSLSTEQLTALVSLTRSEPALQEIAREALINQEAWQSTFTDTAFNAMLTASIRLDDALEIRTTELAQDQSRILQVLLISLIVTDAITMGLLILILWGTHRLILGPLGRLRADVNAVTRTVTHPIHASGPREFRDVMQDTETMRRELVRQIDDAQRAREGLAQQAPLAHAIASSVAATGSRHIGSVDAFGMIASAEGVVTGDWWDVFPCPSQQVGFVIGDVAGHGDRAALLATRLHAILRSALMLGDGPVRACEQAMNAIDDPAQFATAVVGVIDPVRSTCSVVNAGHHEVVHRTPAGIRSQVPTGPMISRLGGRWHTVTSSWDPDDMLICFTDGLIECAAPHGGDLTLNDLLQLIATAPTQQSAQEFAEWIIAEIRQYAPSWGRDDVTLLALRQMAPAARVAR